MTDSMRSLLWLHCMTPLHHGEGQGLGAIDRPIARESTTGYPYLQGASVKGVLRARAFATLSPNDEDRFNAVFGAAPTSSGGDDENNGRRGCLTMTDAQIVLFPVRSLVGTFAWVTSLHALSRLHRVCRLAGLVDDFTSHLGKFLAEAPNIGPDNAIGPKCTGTDPFNDGCLRLAPVAGQEGQFVFENRVLTSEGGNETRELLAKISNEFATLFFPNTVDTYWKKMFRSRLVVVSEDTFVQFCETATQVEANIEIGSKGTTAKGSLRYTESLPTESILVSYLHLTVPKSPEGLGGYVSGLFKGQGVEPVVLQFGGDETKGKGIVRAFLQSGPGVLSESAQAAGGQVASNSANQSMASTAIPEAKP